MKAIKINGNLGLLIEKNTDKENPTDYVQLLPSDLLVVNLSEEEKNYILDELIYFLSKVSKFSLIAPLTYTPSVALSQSVAFMCIGSVAVLPLSVYESNILFDCLIL